MRYTKIAAATLCALGLAACGSTPSNDSSNYYGSRYGNGGAYAEYGRVVGIETVGTSGGSTSGAGAVVGAIAGGVLGHQIGSGRGNDAATVAGAIGGAVVGNEIERRRGNGGDSAYRVDVRLDNGALRSVTTGSVGDIRVGDRVRIEGGNVSRY